ncbi:hypothetical protein ACI3L3_14370 [Desulfobaculum sp. SPO524]|uniref:hypothetical protein n=1 Tax=Desulfobaculum sp. SPO524 TaxID=3378071 RepID=UPI003851E9DA
MLASFDSLNYLFDPVFIPLFRLPLEPLTAYFVGMFLLVLLCTVVGELSLAGAYFLNRKHFAKINQDMIRQHNLSVQAICEKDKASYKACNSLANEAFGQNFFSHIALFASSLWPVPFALGWMVMRFSEVVFPLPFTIPAIGNEVGNNFIFIPLYVAVRVGFAKLKPHLPVFKQILQAIKDNEDPGENLLSWSELYDGKKKDAPGAGAPDKA